MQYRTPQPRRSVLFTTFPVFGSALEVSLRQGPKNPLAPSAGYFADIANTEDLTSEHSRELRDWNGSGSNSPVPALLKPGLLCP